MSNQNTYKTGYKHTQFGWIPEDWDVMRLGDIIEEARLGGNYENSTTPSDVPVIKMGNLSRGKVTVEELQYLPAGYSYCELDILRKDDLLFNTRNTLELVGKVAIWQDELPRAVYNSNILRFKFKDEIVDNNHYMNWVFNSYYGLKQLRGFATGTTSVAAIYGRDLEQFKCLIPTKSEQREIAAILSTWDVAITKTRQLIAQLQLRNKGLMQQLLTGRKRLKGFEGNWKKVRFEQCFEMLRSYPISRDGLCTENTRDKIYCIHYGDIHATYKTIFLDFDIEPSIPQIKNSAFAISESDLLKDGDIIMADASEDYEGVGEVVEVKNLNSKKAVGGLHTIVIREKTGLIVKSFLAFLFTSESVKNQLRKMATGTSVYSVSRATLKSLNFFVPSREEQIAIADLLFNVLQQVRVYERKLAILQKQKKGLMQKLLTGEVRVKIDSNHKNI